ncbi:uncharacterized protein LOC143900640 [Temnothorax americanus]|uniref:uncharacterized protein LOC143900640 n=1 Tax=Temnothorax americanus TaxID=1964332 RepID=UPI004068E729
MVRRITMYRLVGLDVKSLLYTSSQSLPYFHHKYKACGLCYLCEKVSFHSSYINAFFFFFPVPPPTTHRLYTDLNTTIVTIERECTSDLECPNEKACINLQCLDPCALRGACGINALCRVVLHKPRCSCPQCYIGMPHTACHPDSKCDTLNPKPTPSIGCSSDYDCPESLSCHSQTGECRDPCLSPRYTCEVNKRCQVRNHKPMCVCKYGFVVNEIGELTCAPDTLTCSRDFDCPSNAACVNGKCQNPCNVRSKRPCPADKTCDVLDHRPVCICTKNCNPSLSICLRDSGCSPDLACRNYRCVDPCRNSTCPADAPCYVEEHKPICKFCPPGFVPDTKYGCMKDSKLQIQISHALNFHSILSSSSLLKDSSVTSVSVKT